MPTVRDGGEVKAGGRIKHCEYQPSQKADCRCPLGRMCAELSSASAPVSIGREREGVGDEEHHHHIPTDQQRGPMLVGLRHGFQAPDNPFRELAHHKRRLQCPIMLSLPYFAGTSP